jgi:hypothetical protein
MQKVFDHIHVNQQALDGKTLFHQFYDPYGLSNISAVPYKLEDI